MAGRMPSGATTAPELTSQCFTGLVPARSDIEDPIHPAGKPRTPTSSASSGLSREEVLSAPVRLSLNEVREITAEWLERYNEISRTDALGKPPPPARYREQLLAAEIPV